MPGNSLTNDRTARVIERTIKKHAETITKLIQNAYSTDNISEVRCYLSDLRSEYDHYRESFNQALEQIEGETADTKKEEDAIFAHFDDIRKIFLGSTSKATAYLTEFENVRVRESLSNNSTLNATLNPVIESNVKLPRIDIPKFDGKIENFLEFSALFENVIHEELSIPKVRKLYYLKNALTGSAHSLIRDVPLTEQGYDEAWALVLSTYRDMKRIIRTHLDNLFRIKRIANSDELPSLLSKINSSLKGLKACKEDVDSWSTMLSYLVSEKLDEATFLDFEKSLTTNTKFPPWKKLLQFLENRSSIVKRSGDTKPSIVKPKPETAKRTVALSTTKTEPKSPNSSTGSSSSATTNPNSTLRSGYMKPNCVVCSQFHLLIDCDVFKTQTPKQRYESLKSKAICKNCFKANHSTQDCRRTPMCKKCKLPHHTLLHFENEPATVSTESSDPAVSTPANGNAACISIDHSSVSSSSMLSVRKSIVLLPTALVRFKCGHISGDMRVMLDSCSQLNLVSRAFIDRFNLPTRASEIAHVVSGINGTDQSCDRVLNLRIESKIKPWAFNTELNVISTKLPYSVSDVCSESLSIDLSSFKLADPAFNNSKIDISEVDALLGIEAYDQIVNGSVVRIRDVTLRDTKFGWTLTSTIKPRSNIKHDVSLCCLSVSNIDNRLRMFWETEEVNAVNSSSTEAELCNTHFEKTYTRDTQGRFVVRLPFKQDPSVITGNYDIALSQYNRMQARLNNNPDLAVLYREFMNEYINLEHMTLILDAEISNRYFIPHHPVFKPSSTTTQLRVVFNASSKTKSRLSLNDTLMIGPVLQPELFDILLHIRLFLYLIAGDVAKMYRCAMIHPDDRRYQSIIWNGMVYELNTITYGVGPASYLATKCLDELAREVENTQPDVAHIIRSCFYMDDLTMGANTIEEAVRLREAVHQVLARATFILRKYQSNSHEILETIDPTLIETKLTRTIGGDQALSVLGITWTPTLDMLTLKTNLESVPELITKRSILSAIAKVFDPLGLATPVTIRGKLMLQRIWKLGLAWDTEVPLDFASEFRSYISDLRNLESISFPRYIETSESTRLIGFADASEQAYCAAVYLVTNSSSRLYCSKTRVAPVKSLTVPQLELQAATLLVTLIERVNQSVKVPFNQIALFTDSTIVLSWLARPANDWKTFVRNRVAKISSSFPISSWSHVSSHENPADLATRGLTMASFAESTLWTCGPDFISINVQPSSNFEIDERCSSYLSKPKVASCTATETVHDVNTIKSFSSYNKLLRSFAYVRATFLKWKTKSIEPLHLEKSDLDFAFKWLIRLTQSNSFAEDLQRLHSNRKISKRSRLRSMTPFIDPDGILRSRSRLQNARVPFNRKCPIILPTRDHFVTLYIRYIHERFYHANRPFVTSHLSADFIFVGGMSRAVKSVIQNCVTCRRHFFQSKPQQMADLPVDRVTPESPFKIVGIDFTGAFTTKCNYHRMVKFTKSYACIFVCFTTRAVHIELVPSLSSEDFLNAMKCFVSRRGSPTTVYSDNGTNFRGAERYLEFNDTPISRYAIDNRIKWKFNPPYTPHRGGIWEAAVKSAKRFIPLVTKGQVFSENELRTLLTEIEAILNSRPIAYLDKSEPFEEVLTPGHFLVGRNLTTLPEPETSQTIPLSQRYRANQRRVRDFWRLWSQDYFNQLRCRSKWLNTQPNLTENQIVLYKDSPKSPTKWPLARIVRVFPDTNNIIRTVEILTDGQLKTIPTHHVAPLPAATNTRSSDTST